MLLSVLLFLFHLIYLGVTFIAKYKYLPHSFLTAKLYAIQSMYHSLCK